MKAALCILILASSVMTGFGCSLRLSEREKALDKLIELFFTAKQRIAYSSMRLCEVFSDNPAGYTFDEQRPFDEQWREFCARYRHTLKKEDIRLLEEYAPKAGSADLESELDRLELYSELLKERREDARRQIERKSKLYITLGLCVGLAASIILT